MSLSSAGSASTSATSSGVAQRGFGRQALGRICVARGTRQALSTWPIQALISATAASSESSMLAESAARL